MKILYVENHAVFAANVIQHFLSRHTVIVVPTLAEARGALARESFDALLVDYDLDDGKGDTLVRELRAAGSGIFIVGVSSHDAGNESLMRAGASAICDKMSFNKIETVLPNFRP
jgi:DNA-binding response OmpR family regulator